MELLYHFVFSIIINGIQYIIYMLVLVAVASAKLSHDLIALSWLHDYIHTIYIIYIITLHVLYYMAVLYTKL